MIDEDGSFLIFDIDSITFELTKGKVAREIYYQEDITSVRLVLAKHPHEIARLFPLADNYNRETLTYVISKMLYDLEKIC